MLYVIALSVIAGALGLYYFLFKDLNLFTKYGIPQPRPLPLIGNMGPTIFRTQALADLVKQFYDLDSEAKYVGIHDFTTPVIVLRDLELIKSVTLKHFDMFMDHRGVVSEEQDPLFGKNLFSLRGDRWREIRAMLSPTFTSSKMKGMFKLMSEYAAGFSKFLAELPPEQRIIETKEFLTRYTNDTIATCAFGVTVDSVRDPNNLFYVYGKEATSFNVIVLLKIFAFRMAPWLAKMIGMRIVRKPIADFFQDLVETTIKTRDEEGIVRPDMLQLMMENRVTKNDRRALTIEDMTSQAFIFFFGGFDSTSALMCFAAHEIALNDKIRGRLQDEIDQVLERTNGEASYEAVNSMDYLDAVINETLRMYPLGAAMDRLCVKDFELPPTLPGAKPYILRKGQGVFIPTYAFHRDPQYFKEPEKFDPERFLGEQKKQTLNSGAYMPFGLGPRICIGNRFALLETKVLLFHLLARCDLLRCEKTPVPIKLHRSSFIMKPEGGFWIKVMPRENPHRALAVNNANKARDM